MAVGCTALLRKEATQVEPVQIAKHLGADDTAALYAVGRFYQGQMLYDDAIAAYEQLLEKNPSHAEARNALGVIYASQGKIDKAIEAIDVAIGMNPQASHFRNNLGYAYILQGRYAEAEVELLRATALDPANGRAVENLSLARSHLTNFSTGPADSDQSSTTASQGIGSDSPSSKSARLVAVGPSVYELQFPSSRYARLDDQPAERGARPASASRHVLALEIANGNGIAGFAKRTSKYLQKLGYPVARLTNQKPFDQADTEIQYRGGFQLEAEQLKTALAGKPSLIESSQLRAGVEIRLVLGRDATPASLFVKSEGPSIDSGNFEPHMLN